MSTPINILKGQRSVLKWFESVSISMSGGFCNSIDLKLNSLDLYEDFDPNINRGDLSIKVLIGDQTYEFMCEERETPVEVTGTAFSVWGRSKSARLDVPYARIVKDTEDTDHPWQTSDQKVSEIIDYIITNYCDYDVDFSWNVEDFLVYEGTFSVDDQTPISIISSFADVIGAELVAHPDGSLTVEYYQTSMDELAGSYNDFDHIVSLDESDRYTSGYNAITVGGKDSEISPQLFCEVREDSDGNTNWIVGKPMTIRVYYYHQDNSSILYYPLSGLSVSPAGSGSEEITEDVLLTWGSGSTSKFNTEGVSEISGDLDVPLELRSVTYSSNYRDFVVTPTTENETYVMFYFEDKSTNCVQNITADNKFSEQCAALQLDMTADETDSTMFRLKLYGDIGTVSTGYDLAGNSISVPTSLLYEDVEEFLVFNKGVSNLSRPYSSGLSASFPGNVYSLNVSIGETEISIPDHDDDSPTFGAFVSYKTSCHYSDLSIPAIFLDNPDKYSTYQIMFPTVCGDEISASLSLSDTEDVDQSNRCSSISAEFVSSSLEDIQIRIDGDSSLVTKIYDSHDRILSLAGLETETITEDVTFTKGSGSLSKPFFGGMIASEDVSVEKYTTDATIDYVEGENQNQILSLTYLVKYALVNTTLQEADENYTVFIETECGDSISISANVSNEEADCSEFIGELRIHSDYEELKGIDGIETLLNAGGVPSATQRIFHFEYNGDPSKIKNLYCSNGNNITMLETGGDYEEFIEDVQFTKGVGELDNPFYQDISLTFVNKPISPEPGYSIEQYSKQITLDSGPDYEDEYQYLFGKATYKTYWLHGKVGIAATEYGELTVYLETTCGELLSVSTTVPNLFDAEYRNITLNIRDYTTDVNIGNVSVYVDSVYRGKTDSEGNININYIQVGDHTLRLEADGYLYSNEDELSNETFTVE